MAIPFLNSIDLTGNEAQNMRLHRLAADPAAGQGLVIYNTTSDAPKWSDGVDWFFFDEATKLLTARNFSLTNKATAAAVAFNGQADVVLNVTALDVVPGDITLSNGLIIEGNGSNVGAAVAKSAIPLSSWGAPTTNVAFGSFKITNLADPTNPQDAATKAYVDGIATGLDVKAPVRFATTTTLPAYTASGTPDGDILTADANGAFGTTDGVSPVVNDYVLVKDETSTNQKYNGIYEITTLGDGSNPWVLTRRDDADADAEVGSGMFVFVEEGTLNGGTGWVLTTDDPITLGTSLLVFAQFSGASNITAGRGIVQSGSTFHFSQASDYTTNALFYATGATTVAPLSPGSQYNVLKAGASGLPTWGALDLNQTGTAVQGQLGVVNGGTGVASLTDGGILLGSGTAAVTVTSRPSTAQILIGQSSGDPALHAISGDATMSATGVLTLAANSISDAKLRDSAALSVIGNATNATASPADIVASTDHQVLRRNGTTLGFGALNLSQAAATTGILPGSRGGTSSAYFNVSNNLTASRTYQFADWDAEVPWVEAYDIGDGSSKTFLITHSRNTHDVHVMVKGNTGGSIGTAMVFPEINVPSADTVEINFGNYTPTLDEFRVIIMGAPTGFAPGPGSVSGS